MNRKHLISGLLLLVIVLGHMTEVQGQVRWRGFWQVTSAEYDDTQLIYIGIAPQYSFARYSIEKAEKWNEVTFDMPDGSPMQFSGISNPGGHEIGIGVPIRLRLNHHWSLSSGMTWTVERGRYTSSTSSGSGPRLAFNIDDPASPILRMQIGSYEEGENFSTIEVPLHLKLHSDYKNFGRNPHPYRLYLLGGTKFNRYFNADNYYSDIGNFKEEDPSMIFKNSHWNMEAGLGIDLYYTYFKMSIETRYSQSIGDLLDRNHKRPDQSAGANPYMNALSKVGIRGWQFSIILE